MTRVRATDDFNAAATTSNALTIRTDCSRSRARSERRGARPHRRQMGRSWRWRGFVV